MAALTCPRCNKEVTLLEGKLPPEFPFCSDRCRDVDLHRWLAEDYSVPVETNRVIEQALDERSAGLDPDGEMGYSKLN